MALFVLQEPPPKPPKQWFPQVIRWPIRVLLWPFVVLDVAIQGLFRPALPYRIDGKCKERGDCCRYVVVPVPKRSRLLGAVSRFYLTQIHGFYERAFGVDGASIYSCRYLVNHRCTHYALRPAVCRQWARARHHTPPTLLPGCGFRVVVK